MWETRKVCGEANQSRFASLHLLSCWPLMLKTGQEICRALTLHADLNLDMRTGTAHPTAHIRSCACQPTLCPPRQGRSIPNRSFHFDTIPAPSISLCKHTRGASLSSPFPSRPASIPNPTSMPLMDQAWVGAASNASQ